jgi:hypothetical protein
MVYRDMQYRMAIAFGLRVHSGDMFEFVLD